MARVESDNKFLELLRLKLNELTPGSDGTEPVSTLVPGSSIQIGHQARAAESLTRMAEFAAELEKLTKTTQSSSTPEPPFPAGDPTGVSLRTGSMQLKLDPALKPLIEQARALQAGATASRQDYLAQYDGAPLVPTWPTLSGVSYLPIASDQDASLAVMGYLLRAARTEKGRDLTAQEQAVIATLAAIVVKKNIIDLPLDKRIFAVPGWSGMAQLLSAEATNLTQLGSGQRELKLDLSPGSLLRNDIKNLVAGDQPVEGSVYKTSSSDRLYDIALKAYGPKLKALGLSEADEARYLSRLVAVLATYNANALTGSSDPSAASENARLLILNAGNADAVALPPFDLVRVYMSEPLAAGIDILLQSLRGGIHGEPIFTSAEITRVLRTVESWEARGVGAKPIARSSVLAKMGVSQELARPTLVVMSSSAGTPTDTFGTADLEVQVLFDAMKKNMGTRAAGSTSTTEKKDSAEPLTLAVSPKAIAADTHDGELRLEKELKQIEEWKKAQAKSRADVDEQRAKVNEEADKTAEKHSVAQKIEQQGPEAQERVAGPESSR